MKTLASTASLSLLLLGRASALNLPRADAAAQPKPFNLEQFIAKESPRSVQGILDNIGPGVKCDGCSPGVVVASPNAVEPDYR